MDIFPQIGSCYNNITCNRGSLTLPLRFSLKMGAYCLGPILAQKIASHSTHPGFGRHHLIMTLQWGSFEVNAAIAASLGEVPLAAHAILSNTAAIWYCTPSGLAAATTAWVGSIFL